MRRCASRWREFVFEAILRLGVSIKRFLILECWGLALALAGRGCVSSLDASIAFRDDVFRSVDQAFLRRACTGHERAKDNDVWAQ